MSARENNKLTLMPVSHVPNVLHVISNITAAFGGSMMTMNNIASMWQLNGYKAHILSLETPGKKFPIEIDLTLVPPSFPARFSNSNQAVEWLERHFTDYDLVVFHSVWTIVYLRLAAILRRNRRRYVIIPHGSLDPFDLQKKAFAKRILGPLLIRPFLQGSVGVICSSQREADCLITYGAKCNVTTIPWPIPPVASIGDREEARRHFGFHNQEFVVLSLGRIDYKKGFPVLLPAIQRLAQSGITTRLLIVGPDSGGYSTVVRQMVERLGLNEIVTFLPPVVGDEKSWLMKAADCFALPSLNENFGNVVIEAMQQGLPCVISNNVYICDEVENGGAGLVCNYDDKEVFAALRKLSESPELRAKMSDAAIRMAKNFEPEVLKERYLALLERLVGSRG
jgi:glycosyltransferase involved in cell wall biosynthesis